MVLKLYHIKKKGQNFKQTYPLKNPCIYLFLPFKLIMQLNIIVNYVMWCISICFKHFLIFGTFFFCRCTAGETRTAQAYCTALPRALKIFKNS